MKTLFLILAAVFSSSSLAGLKVETFNLGLARGFVPLAAERKAPLLEAITKSEADVLCLQEVWSLSDRIDVAEALSKRFQSLHSTPVYQTTTSSRPSCAPWQLLGPGKFVTCMQKQCSDFSGDAFTQCIVTKCGDSLNRLKAENRECASALMAKVGKNPILSLLQLINPFYRSGLYAYRGSNGLVLASKFPLKEKSLIDFSDISTLNRRQALTAKIEYKGEEIFLACSHLTSHLKVPYTGQSGSWAKENFAQVERLIKKTSLHSKAILMGDFNCGLEDLPNNLSEELPESCLLLQKHFKDPVTRTGKCTYCSNNLLNEGVEVDKLIDHVFTKGFVSLQEQIIYDKPIMVETAKGPLKTHLSDHFGAQVLLE